MLLDGSATLEGGGEPFCVPLPCVSRWDRAQGTVIFSDLEILMLGLMFSSCNLKLHGL